MGTKYCKVGLWKLAFHWGKKLIFTPVCTQNSNHKLQSDQKPN